MSNQTTDHQQPDNRKRKGPHPFNVILSEQQYQMLRDLAGRTDATMGQALRAALQRAHRMICMRQPTCANGQACYVPHMHPPATTNVDYAGQTVLVDDPKRTRPTVPPYPQPTEPPSA